MVRTDVQRERMITPRTTPGGGVFMRRGCALHPGGIC
jgi:hypothetical protein